MRSSSHHFPFVRATAAYVVALLILLVAAAAGYVFISVLHEQTAHDAALVNAAGRQRMLAQRIVRMALMARFARTDIERDLRIADLAGAVEEWERGDEAIVQGKARSRIALVLVSAPLTSGSLGRLASSRDELVRVVAGFLRSKLLAMSDEDFAVLCAGCDAYVTEMDRFVLAIQGDSETRTRNVGRALVLVLGLSTLLIVLEGVWVFRPLIQRLRAAHAGLLEAHERLREEVERRRAVESERDVLRGLLPICASCKKIRDDSGEWLAMERYIEDRSEARFSHGLCEDCVRRLYPEIAGRMLSR